MYDSELNENWISGMVDKVWDFFEKKFKKAAWLYYALFLKKKGALEGKVDIFPYGSKPDESKISGIEKEIDNLSEEEETEELSIEDAKLAMNEDKVPLEHPNPEVGNYVPSEMSNILIRKFKMKTKYPNKMFSTFIWGASGIGKTDVINATAKELQVDCLVWHLATIEPTDFIGLPEIEVVKGRDTKDAAGVKVEGDTSRRTTFRLPKIFPSDNGENGKGGIMFFDELNRANEHVLSASLQLCLDGQVGEYKLPDKWLIIAAGNRREEEPTVTDLGTALANRFTHYNLITTKDEWVTWAIKQDYMDPDVIGYIDFNKDILHHLDPDKETPNWPSPRSWASASLEYTEAKEASGNQLSKEAIKKLFNSHVGNTAAVQFAEYLDLLAVFPPKDIALVYKKPEEAPMPPKRIDRSRAVTAAIGMAKKGEKLTAKELENLITYARRIENMEVATSLLQHIKKTHDYVTTDDPWKKIWVPSIKKWYNKFADILNPQ